jgi:hypothetical protein
MPSHYSELEIQEIGKRAWKTASRAAKHMSKHSKIVNPSMEKCIPRFEREEVILGDVLGSGGFNDVYEVKQINLVEDLTKSKHAKKISSPLQNEHRAFVAKHVFRESSQNCRYAVKFLSVETIEDPNRFCTGAADLVVVCRIGHGVNHNCPLVGAHRWLCFSCLTCRRPSFWRRFLTRTLSSFVEWRRPGHPDLPV